MPRTALSHADAGVIESAERLLAAGDPHQAAAALLPLLPRYRDNPDFLLLLARAQADGGQLADAAARLHEALRLAPDDARLHSRLALIHRRTGDFEAALASADRSLGLNPADPLTIAARADILDMSARHPEAWETLAPALAARPVHLAIAVAFARLAPRLGREAEAIDTLESALAQEPGAAPNRAVALFALANLLDAAGAFDRAFDAATRAHALRRAPFDPDAHTRQIDQTIAAWTPDAINTLARARPMLPRAVLIVGMPRSGTSLVEQILASHPSIFGAGERAELTRIAHELSGRAAIPILTDPAPLRRQSVERCARRYLGVLRESSSGSDSPIITDKNPTNFLHLGLASALLPDLRVIHCTRDPRDTGLSCWFHDFGGILSFVHNLEHIATYWRDYRRLVAHWRSVLDTPILDVAYEDLIADQQAQTRRLLDFLALPWNDACLSFHKTDRITLTDSNRQVRRPLYTSSVGRWRHYESHLGPLLSLT